MDLTQDVVYQLLFADYIIDTIRLLDVVEHLLQDGLQTI